MDAWSILIWAFCVYHWLPVGQGQCLFYMAFEIIKPVLILEHESIILLGTMDKSKASSSHDNTKQRLQQKCLESNTGLKYLNPLNKWRAST